MNFIKNAFWTVAVLLNIFSWFVFASVFVLPGLGAFQEQSVILIAIALSVMPVMAAIAVSRAK